ncbi:hypothetical protein HPB47_009777 [Ixodes persulcatus]|uniref:Uncharacterized protein n=1 Tax=Ixodes persulcatus TaxID=34615 RepID=A0AC60P0X6_IXOPE|nr:hypothetical protein HPB47_009777 [Ixodes persulcatus]
MASMPRTIFTLCETWLDPSIHDSQLVPPDLLRCSVEHIAALRSTYHNAYILGDFNAHIDWTVPQSPLPQDPTSDVLLDLFETSGFTQLCMEATYTANTGKSSCLDLCFTLNPTLVRDCAVTAGLSNSDHKAIQLSTFLSLPIRGKHSRLLRAYSKLDFEHLHRLVRLVPWDALLSEHDIDDMCETYTSLMTALTSDTVPLKRAHRPRSAPWLTSDIIALCKQKDRVFRRAKRSRCPEDLAAAKDIQRDVKKRIRMAHRASTEDIAARAVKEPKLFWAFVNSQRKQALHPSFSVANGLLSCPSDIAEAFNKQFAAHGFRRGRSCETALGTLVHIVSAHLDDRTPVELVQLDLSRAFDRLPHPGLLASAELKGLRGPLLRWLGSFLTGPYTFYRRATPKNEQLPYVGISSTELLRHASWQPLDSRVRASTVQLMCRVMSPGHQELPYSLRLNKRTGRLQPLLTRTQRHGSSRLPRAAALWRRLPSDHTRTFPPDADDLKTIMRAALRATAAGIPAEQRLGLKLRDQFYLGRYRAVPVALQNHWSRPVPPGGQLPENSQVSNSSSSHAVPRQAAQLGLTIGPTTALPAGGGAVDPPPPTPQEDRPPDDHDVIVEMTDATEGLSSFRTYARKRCRLTVDDAVDDADTGETGTPSQDEGLRNGDENAEDDVTMDEHSEGHRCTLPGRRRRPKPPRGSHLPCFDLEKFTVIIQPTGPVGLTKIYDLTTYRQLLETAGSQAREDLLIFTKNFKANAISILKLKELETYEGKLEVNVYRATIGAMPRGVIRRVEPGKSAEDVLQNSHDPELKRRLVDRSRQLGLCPYEDTPRRPANPPAESSEASDTLLVRFASTHDSGFSSPVSALDKSFRFVQ